MKSEPSVFGIDDLAAAPKRTSCWDGVRNYQVRNMLRDEFAVGDLAFFCSDMYAHNYPTITRTAAIKCEINAAAVMA